MARPKGLPAIASAGWWTFWRPRATASTLRSTFTAANFCINSCG